MEVSYRELGYSQHEVESAIGTLKAFTGIVAREHALKLLLSFGLNVERAANHFFTQQDDDTNPPTPRLPALEPDEPFSGAGSPASSFASSVSSSVSSVPSSASSVSSSASSVSSSASSVSNSASSVSNSVSSSFSKRASGALGRASGRIPNASSRASNASSSASSAANAFARPNFHSGRSPAPALSSSHRPSPSNQRSTSSSAAAMRFLQPSAPKTPILSKRIKSEHRRSECRVYSLDEYGALFFCRNCVCDECNKLAAMCNEWQKHSVRISTRYSSASSSSSNGPGGSSSSSSSSSSKSSGRNKKQSKRWVRRRLAAIPVTFELLNDSPAYRTLRSLASIRDARSRGHLRIPDEEEQTLFQEVTCLCVGIDKHADCRLSSVKTGAKSLKVTFVLYIHRGVSFVQLSGVNNLMKKLVRDDLASKFDDAMKIGERFQTDGFSLSMDGLLEFSCRKEMLDEELKIDLPDQKEVDNVESLPVPKRRRPRRKKSRVSSNSSSSSSSSSRDSKRPRRSTRKRKRVVEGPVDNDSDTPVSSDTEPEDDDSDFEMDLGEEEISGDEKSEYTEATESENEKKNDEEKSDKMEVDTPVDGADNSGSEDSGLDEKSLEYGLDVTLRDYQKQAVNWMIREERSESGVWRHFWFKCRFDTGETYYYSPYFSRFCFDKPEFSHGGFLCEEMGLGKTVEMLALIASNPLKNVPVPYVSQEWENLERHPSGATLIIAATSLVGQWQDEIQRKASKKLNCTTYYGPSRTRAPGVLAACDIVLTTYGLLQRERGTEMSDALHFVDWHRIVLDESHTIKNRNAVQTKSIMNLQGRNRWCLTGTPMNNSLLDIHGQIEFIGLKPANTVKFWASANRNFIGGNLNQIRPVLRVFQRLMMRHKKNQEFNGKPLLDLPPKEETNLVVEFTPEQLEAYKKLYKLARIRYDGFVASGRAVANTLQVMSLLLPLRKACSGGDILIQSLDENIKAAERSAEERRAFGLMREVSAALVADSALKTAIIGAFNDENDECTICLDIMEQPLQTPCRHLFCAECIRGAIGRAPRCPICRKPVSADQLREPKREKVAGEPEPEEEKKDEKPVEDPSILSNVFKVIMDSKLKILMSDLEKLRRESPDAKVLVFTQFNDTLQWLKSKLTENNFKFRTLSGSMTLKQRSKALNAFQNDPPTTIFLLSVRCGAVGLTLTAASHVYMLEPCLNLALERQAINRVYRFGQTKKVFVKKLVMKGTVEEKIVKINADKHSADFSGGNLKRDKKKLRFDELQKLFEE